MTQTGIAPIASVALWFYQEGTSIYIFLIGAALLMYGMWQMLKTAMRNKYARVRYSKGLQKFKRKTATCIAIGLILIFISLAMR
jgi:hypothetical protein